jgi:hypothetical protein
MDGFGDFHRIVLFVLNSYKSEVEVDAHESGVSS